MNNSLIPKETKVRIGRIIPTLVISMLIGQAGQICLADTQSELINKLSDAADLYNSALEKNEPQICMEIPAGYQYPNTAQCLKDLAVVNADASVCHRLKQDWAKPKAEVVDLATRRKARR